MKLDLKKFFLELLGITIVVLVLILLAVHFIFEPDRIQEIVLGCVISLAIFLLGFVSINWAFNRSLKTFMAVVLGGMFFRFVLIGAALFLFMRFTQIHVLSFILAFFVFYLIYQIFEIRFIHVKLSKGKKWLEVLKGRS